MEPVAIPTPSIDDVFKIFLPFLFALLFLHDNRTCWMGSVQWTVAASESEFYTVI